MTIKPEVLSAISRVDHCELHSFDADWQTIRAELLAMDAEINRLNAACKQHLRQAMENGRDANRAESRLAAADALLRELGEWDLMNIPTATAIQLDRKIETYLQSEPRP